MQIIKIQLVALSKNNKEVCVQLPTSADNVALFVFAAARRAAAQLLLTAGLPAVQQSIDIFWSPGPQQPTCSSDMQRVDETDGRTDRRTLESCIVSSSSAYFALAVT